MKYSIIIPDVNSHVIDKTLHSLVNLHYDSSLYEVIVVGRDDVNKIISHPLVYFDQTDKPYSPAINRNRGADKAKGEILVFIDADCIASNSLLKYMDELFCDPTIDGVGGGIRIEQKNYWTIADNISMFHDFLITQPPGYRETLPSLNFAIRKNIFLEAGGFNENYPKPSGEDFDLTMRLTHSGKRLFFLPTAWVVHAPERNSIKHLILHAYYQGMYSTKLTENRGISKFIFSSPFWPIMLSPLLALVVSSLIFLRHLHLLRYAYTFPALIIAKWHGALVRLDHRSFHPKGLEMKMDFRVSVLIPNYNRASNIGDVVYHLLNQTVAPDEIIVVDDASTDNSCDVLEKLPVILVRHNKNCGPAVARNTAYKASTGDILVFIDSDAYAEKQMLESLIKVYQSDHDPKLGGVGGKGVESVQQTVYDRWRTIHSNQSFGFKKKKVLYLYGLCCSYKREVFDRVKGFDPFYPKNAGEDLDLGYRINREGFYLTYTPNAVVFHQHSDTYESLKRVQYNWTYWNYVVRKRNNKQIESIPIGILRRLVLETVSDLLLRRSLEMIRLDFEIFTLKWKAFLDAKKFYSK